MFMKYQEFFQFRHYDETDESTKVDYFSGKFSLSKDFSLETLMHKVKLVVPKHHEFFNFLMAFFVLFGM